VSGRGKNTSMSPSRTQTQAVPSPSTAPFSSPFSAPSTPPSSPPVGKSSPGFVLEEEQIYADIRESERRIMGLEDERRAKHYLEIKSRSAAPAT
jgi:hypothetical protein